MLADDGEGDGDDAHADDDANAGALSNASLLPKETTTFVF